MYQAVLICSLGVVIGLGSLLHLLLLLLLCWYWEEKPAGKNASWPASTRITTVIGRHSGHRAESSLAGLALMETPSSSPC